MDKNNDKDFGIIELFLCISNNLKIIIIFILFAVSIALVVRGELDNPRNVGFVVVHDSSLVPDKYIHDNIYVKKLLARGALEKKEYPYLEVSAGKYTLYDMKINKEQLAKQFRENVKLKLTSISKELKDLDLSGTDMTFLELSETLFLQSLSPTIIDQTVNQISFVFSKKINQYMSPTKAVFIGSILGLILSLLFIFIRYLHTESKKIAKSQKEESNY